MTDISVFESDKFRRLLDIASSMKEPPSEDNSLRQAWFLLRARELVLSMETKLGRRLRSCVITFGCQMNEHDSEKIKAILSLAGYEESGSEDSDFVLYNTCTVRENANTRLLGRLGAITPYRKENKLMIIALCGCMMQEKGVPEMIRRDYRYVKLVFGTHNIHRFAELLVRTLISPGQIIDIDVKGGAIVEDLPSKRRNAFKSGINIMYGCDNFCSYCIVPYVRGRERSRAPEDILLQISTLAEAGVVEVMLLGQNVNSYGKGLPQGYSFSRLLRETCKIDGLKRIRFMTSHPKDLSDDLILTIAENEKICHHLHLPVQSGSTRILKMMNRHYTRDDYLRLIERLYSAVPDISLTTDIIIGFPGETEEDFQETLDLVRRAQFDSAFTFIYSRRSGTPAAYMKDQVPEDVVRDRFDRLLDEVRRIGKMRSSRFESTIQKVLVDGVNKQDNSLMSGRISNNLIVHFKGGPNLIGKIVPVKLTKAKGFYYFGETQ